MLEYADTLQTVTWEEDTLEEGTTKIGIHPFVGMSKRVSV